jgi:hypothetical protein
MRHHRRLAERRSEQVVAKRQLDIEPIEGGSGCGSGYGSGYGDLGGWQGGDGLIQFAGQRARLGLTQATAQQFTGLSRKVRAAQK